MSSIKGEIVTALIDSDLDFYAKVTRVLEYLKPLHDVEQTLSEDDCKDLGLRNLDKIVKVLSTRVQKLKSLRDHEESTGVPNSVKKIVHRFFKVQMQDLRASKWYYEQFARIEPTFERLDRGNELFHVTVAKGKKLDPPIDVLANLSIGARRLPRLRYLYQAYTKRLAGEETAYESTMMPFIKQIDEVLKSPRVMYSQYDIPPRKDFSDEAVGQQMKIHASNNARSFPNPSDDPEGEYSTEASASAQRYHTEQLAAPVSPHAHEFATPVLSRHGSSNGKLSPYPSELKTSNGSNSRSNSPNRMRSPDLGEHLAEIQRVRNTYAKQVQALQEDLQDKEAQLEQLRSQIPDDDESSSLRDDLDEALQREGTLERERDTLTSRIRRFEKGGDGMESYQDLLTRAAKAEQAQGETLARIQEYEREVSSLNTSIETKEQEVASLTSKLRSSISKDQLQQMQVVQQESAGIIKTLREKLSQKSSDLRLIEMEKEVLEQRLADAEEKKSAAEVEHRELNEQLSSRQDTLDNLESTRRSLEEGNAKLLETVQTYKQNIEALNATVSQIRSKEESHREDLDSLRQENEDLTARRVSSEAVCGEMRRHLSELLLEADLSQDSNFVDESELADHVHTLKNEISRLRLASAANGGEVDALEAELSSTLEKNESLTKQIAHLKTSQSEVKRSNSQTGKRRKELSKKDRKTLHRISNQLNDIEKKVPLVAKPSSFRRTMKSTLTVVLATLFFLFALFMYVANPTRRVAFYY